MKAILIKRHGEVERAFSLEEVDKPAVEPHEVLIKNQAFGLNYADVLARKGLYPDAPPLPALVGYEVVGRIEDVGSEVQGFEQGQRVIAFTRFGGYAEYTTTDHRAVVAIDEEVPNGEAVALATQYCTAYYAAYEMLNLLEGEVVLIHAAAGGVGTALMQLARAKGCEVIGTAGSDEKLTYIKEKGADHAINYRTHDFQDEVQRILGNRYVDVVFDPIGGKTFKKGLELLSYGGKIVLFGAASRSKGGILSGLKLLFGFGFHSPLRYLIKSQSVLGVNMLRIADYRPDIIQLCLSRVYALYEQEIIKPHVGGVFKANDIATAHALLENRKSKGKIVVEWPEGPKTPPDGQRADAKKQNET